VPQSFRHATREQEPIQRALIFGQHTVGSTRGEANTHQPELARAVSSDRVDEIK
jgi:hypothetical protein